eukprot:2068999-Prymnesium_polylepis.1
MAAGGATATRAELMQVREHGSAGWLRWRCNSGGRCDRNHALSSSHTHTQTQTHTHTHTHTHAHALTHKRARAAAPPIAPTTAGWAASWPSRAAAPTALSRAAEHRASCA